MFARLNTLIRGFLSLFITGLEKANPRALIDQSARTCEPRFRASTTASRSTPGSASADAAD